jgi:hypothetical protein
MFSSQWLQQHPAILVALRIADNVQCFLLPFYLGWGLMTEGLYFDVIVFFLEKSVNENWSGGWLLNSEAKP